MRKDLVYLDVCALHRTFYDQTLLRIRLETEAVNLILSKVHLGAMGDGFGVMSAKSSDQ